MLGFAHNNQDTRSGPLDTMGFSTLLTSAVVAERSASTFSIASRMRDPSRWRLDDSSPISTVADDGMMRPPLWYMQWGHFRCHYDPPWGGSCQEYGCTPWQGSDCHTKPPNQLWIIRCQRILEEWTNMTGRRIVPLLPLETKMVFGHPPNLFLVSKRYPIYRPHRNRTSHVYP